jgi:hypothetical protein
MGFKAAIDAFRAWRFYRRAKRNQLVRYPHITYNPPTVTNLYKSFASGGLVWTENGPMSPDEAFFWGSQWTQQEIEILRTHKPKLPITYNKVTVV